MEDIRISDSDLKKKWKSHEKNLGDVSDGYVVLQYMYLLFLILIQDQVKEHEESPKRDKRKLFGRQSQRKSSRKSRKYVHIPALYAHLSHCVCYSPSEFYSSMSVDTDSGSMKRSLSMELITRPTESTPFGPKIASQAHRAISPEGLPCFQVHVILTVNTVMHVISMVILICTIVTKYQVCKLLKTYSRLHMIILVFLLKYMHMYVHTLLSWNVV